MFSVKAAIHGVVDPVFAAKVPVELRDQWRIEINRIEAQLSLMLSHVEGEWENRVARARLLRVWLPVAVGFIAGVAAASAFIWLR